MALVHLNAKEATTVAMRTLSGLKGNEKIDFPNYFKELGTFSNYRMFVTKQICFIFDFIPLGFRHGTAMMAGENTSF